MERDCGHHLRNLTSGTIARADRAFQRGKMNHDGSNFVDPQVSLKVIIDNNKHQNDDISHVYSIAKRVTYQSYGGCLHEREDQRRRTLIVQLEVQA